MEVSIFDATADLSWYEIPNLEHQIDHELLDILGPNDTEKPSSEIAMTPTNLEYDFLDMEEAYVGLDELLVDMKSTLDTAFQCPTLDFPVVSLPTNTFKGPRNLRGALTVFEVNNDVTSMTIKSIIKSDVTTIIFHIGFTVQACVVNITNQHQVKYLTSFS